MSDLVFHLLDIQARDMRIESEQEDVVEVAYDSHSDEDDEIQTRRQTKKTATSGSQRQFIIHLFGATETGQPLRCDVTGFRPTMYLRLPEEKTSAAASSIQKHIRDQLTKQRLSYTDLIITRITKKIFYGFTAQTFYPFLQIDVPSISLFRTLRNIFLDEFLNPTMFLDDNVNIVTKRPDAPPPRGKKIEVFEANLDPMLRFLHVQNIQPCGWVCIKDGKKSITSNQGHSLVLECDYEQIVPTQGPRVSAPFLTASWDIECFSRTGDFPVAKRSWSKAAKELLKLAKSSEDVIAFVTNSICTTDLNTPDTLTKGMTTIYATFKKGMTLERVHMELTKAADSFDTVLKMSDGQEAMEQLLGKTLNRIVTLIGDPVIQIGTTLTRGTADTTERHLFVFPDCADIPGIEVHVYPTEELMIVAWFDWMIERDPDILIGYNVFGFDESYLWARAEELKLVKENAAFHAMNRLMELSGELKLEEKFLSSSAMGDNRMYIWTTQGRLQIDLFYYIKRNNVLPSYKLDEVTKHFMSGKLKKQSYDAATRQLRLEVAGAIKDVRTGRAITLLDETGETVSQKLMIDTVDGNVLLITCDLDEDALVEMEDATKWVVVKDDVSPQDIFRLHRGSAEDRAVVGKYCLPEDEHQILTNRGYMYLHELLELWGDDINSPPATTDLLLAGFNSDTKQLVYERPNRLILNDYCVDQDMVEFTQHSYSDRWDKDNMFGLTEQQRCTIQSVEKEDIEYRTPNFVSLITTPGHDMYARCGFVTGDKNQYPRMTTGKGRTPILYKKIKSKDLLGKGTPKIIKLMGRVENGIVSDEVHSIPYPFTSECNLKITTREQQIAFLELYGYWLGDGSILIKRGKPESITFNIVKKSDAEWLEKTFQILDIHDRSSYKNSKEYEMPDVSDGVYKIPRQTQYVIKIFDEAYKKFFFDEYLIKYTKTDASSDRVKDFADVAKMINRNTCESTINTDATLHLSNNTEIEEIKSAKWLMNWVWGLSKDSARAIINGIVLADGSHHKGKALKHIFTSSTRFRDEVERLAFHAGYAPYSTVCYLAGSVRGQSADGKPVTANHTLWSVNFPENEQFSEPTLKREENDIKYVKYTGRTWCVSMPTTFIVARRARCVNGIVSHASRPLVIGNCLQDCDLVIDLYKKLETFNNSMSMANVCSVPVSYIFTRGQGIKIESLMFKCCRERSVLIPVLPVPTQGGDDSYEGAIVLDPQPGFYSTSPIGVCDFASLYPSTIVSENISHDSLLWVKDFTNEGELIAHQWGSEVYDECEGYAFTDIEYDIIRSDPSDTRKHPRKIKCGRRICRFAQPLDGTKSTLPQITTWLLTARSAKKKEMKAEKDPERYALLDAEQLAYKLTGNSLYGQLGSGTFKIRLQALAASVTAYGRKQILYAKAAIEKFYGPEAKNPKCAARCMAKVVYGDSVTGDTPLVLRNDMTGALFIKRMDELRSENEWKSYHDTKDAIPFEGVSVWTERGFTPIRKIIRHKLHKDKKLFRINTHTGIVDVTEDHSLVLKDGTEAKPCDVAIGTELLHNDALFQEFNTASTPCTITKDEAFVMGFFVADGSSDVYDCPSGTKASWAINKADMGLLVTAMNKCPFPTKILNTIESSGVYKLVALGKITEIANRYRTLFYNGHREKKIPDEIMSAPIEIVQSFWDGFYAGDGDKDTNGYIRFDQKGKEIGAGMYLLARRLGYNVSINERESKELIFRYTMTKKTQRKNACAIKKYRELPHPGDDVYVYDLETENHHFGVGPGALIVHNTDSLFVEFNPRNPETGERLTGREARVATIEMTDEAGALITKTLAAPHDFEFDKAFDPLLMFSKKRYAGNMYEENPDDYVHKYMGIALKRRDNAPIVKTIFGGAMKMLLDKRDVVGAFQFVKEKCLELVDGKVNLGQLTVTKSLRADYADPARIAHKALADRITMRDPGNAPAAGDRIGYVYISAKAGQEASKLQGERIETPQFIKDHQLVPDYRHYIEHQLQNPISQAFGLLLEQIPGFQKDMIRNCPTVTEDLDKYLAFREAKAAELLFSDCLKRFEKSSTRQAITGMFKGSVVISKAAITATAKPATSASTATTSSTTSTTKPVTRSSAPITKQTTMSSFLLDSMIVDGIKKKNQAKAAAATRAANKKAKEESS